MLIFFLSSALAQDSGTTDTAVPCDVSVLAASPPLGAADVPLDVTPQLVLVSTCTSLVSNLELRDEGGAVATGTGASSTLGTHNTLPLEQPLDADTTYTLTVYGDYPGVTELSFTTGSANLSALSGAPEISGLTITEDTVDSGGYGGLDVVMEVTPVTDPDGLGLLAAYGASETDEAIAWAEVGSGGTVTLTGRWLGDTTETLCFAAGQFDGAGLEFGRSEEACVEPDAWEKDPCACSSGRSAGGWVAALALLLLRRRTAGSDTL